MSAPYFQTDDIPDGHIQPPSAPTCKCTNPATLWRSKFDLWHCTKCGKTIRGEARAKLKDAIRAKTERDGHKPNRKKPFGIR